MSRKNLVRSLAFLIKTDSVLLQISQKPLLCFLRLLARWPETPTQALQWKWSINAVFFASLGIRADDLQRVLCCLLLSACVSRLFHGVVSLSVQFNLLLYLSGAIVKNSHLKKRFGTPMGW
jgi:hypothetical protein